MTFCSGRFWVGPSSVLVLLLFPPGDLSLVHSETFHLGIPSSFRWMGGVSLSVILRV